MLTIGTIGLHVYRFTCLMQIIKQYNDYIQVTASTAFRIQRIWKIKENIGFEDIEKYQSESKHIEF